MASCASTRAREAGSVAPVRTIGLLARTSRRAAPSRPSSRLRSKTRISCPRRARSVLLESASKPIRRRPRAVISASRASSSTTRTEPRRWLASSTAARSDRASRTSSNRRSIGGATPSTIASSSSAFSRASVDRKRCSAAASSGLGDEPVPDATYGFDPTGFLQRAAKLVRSLLDAVLEALEIVAPHVLEQVSSRHHIAIVRREQLEHQHRPPLELQRLRFEKGKTLRGVNSQTTPHHDPIAPGALTQRAANTRQQHLTISSLDDVVGRSALDSDHLVARRMPCASEDDDGKRDAIGARTQLIQDFGRLHVGHLVVE